jgi:anthranilate/para-aminobenzoate synthase component II
MPLNALKKFNMKDILVIDNYDSFTYNLVHYLEDLECSVTVKRNDQLELKEVDNFDKIVLSPGPGIPDEAGPIKTHHKNLRSNEKYFRCMFGDASNRRSIWCRTS